MRTLSSVAAVVVLSAVSGCSAAAAPATAQLTIELRYPLIAGEVTPDKTARDPCVGALEYADIAEGGAVTFRDASERIVGTATLPPAKTATLMDCRWQVSASVESPSKFLIAEVGGWRSAPVEVDANRADFHLRGWRAEDGGRTPQVDPAWSRVAK